MWIRTLNQPGIALQTHVIGDSVMQQAVVIDPPRHVQPLLDLLKLEKLSVRYIFETHVHADFISGSVELQERLKEHPPIVCSAMGGTEWIPTYATFQANQGDVFECGCMRFEALHTPGHTPEHVTWLLYDLDRSGLVPYAAFTGDFLFAGSVGRPDLLGKEKTQALLKSLHHSLYVTLVNLPDFLLIYPAHGKGSLCGKNLAESSVTTLGYERKVNPYLQQANEEEWNQIMIESMPEAPILFNTIKQQNRAAPHLMRDIPEPSPVPYQQLLHLEQSAQYIDVRPPLLFAFGHFPGFVNVPLTPQFTYWVSIWRDPTLPLFIVATDEKELKRALEQLALIGIEKIEGYFCLSHQLSEELIGSLLSIPCLSPTWVEHLLTQQQGHYCLLDVRFENERQAASIPGSIGILLPELLHNWQDVPKGMPVAVHCRTGARASFAASFLKKVGFKEVSVMLGGIEGWKEAELPLEGFLQQKKQEQQNQPHSQNTPPKSLV